MPIAWQRVSAGSWRLPDFMQSLRLPGTSHLYLGWVVEAEALGHTAGSTGGFGLGGPRSGVQHGSSLPEAGVGVCWAHLLSYAAPLNKSTDITVSLGAQGEA